MYTKVVSKLKCPDLGILLIRIAVGGIFAYAGWFKISNMSMIVEAFGTMGFAPFWAYVVMFAEFIGGIATILGVFLVPANALFVIIMAMVIFKVKWGQAFTAIQFDAVLLLSAVALMTLGAGKYSISAFWERRKAVSASVTNGN